MGDFLLSELKVGESCAFKEYKQTVPLKLKRRLLELGFVEGVKIHLNQISFLNEVFLVELNGYVLSIRKNIAENMVVKRQ